MTTLPNSDARVAIELDADVHERLTALLDTKRFADFDVSKLIARALSQFAPDFYAVFTSGAPKYVYEYDEAMSDKPCTCGHPYHRHFDWSGWHGYEDEPGFNAPVGCKYCVCHRFTLKEE